MLLHGLLCILWLEGHFADHVRYNVPIPLVVPGTLVAVVAEVTTMR